MCFIHQHFGDSTAVKDPIEGLFYPMTLYRGPTVFFSNTSCLPTLAQNNLMQTFLGIAALLFEQVS